MSILSTKFFTDCIYNTTFKGQESQVPRPMESEEEEEEPLFIGAAGYIPICKYHELRGTDYELVTKQKGHVSRKRQRRPYDEDAVTDTEIGRFGDIVVWERDGEIYSSEDESPKHLKMHHKKVYGRRRGFTRENAA